MCVACNCIYTISVHTYMYIYTYNMVLIQLAHTCKTVGFSEVFTTQLAATHTLYLGRWVPSTVLTKIIVSRSRAVLPWGWSRYVHVHKPTYFTRRLTFELCSQRLEVSKMHSFILLGGSSVILSRRKGGSHTPVHAGTDTLSISTHTFTTCTLGRGEYLVSAS